MKQLTTGWEKETEAKRLLHYLYQQHKYERLTAATKRRVRLQRIFDGPDGLQNAIYLGSVVLIVAFSIWLDWR